MRIIQTIIQKLACIVVLAGGAALAIFSVSGLYGVVIAQLPEPNPTLRVAIGCVAIALAVLALLPLGGRRRKAQQLSFAGPNGPNTVHLDSAAATLNKRLSKVSIVKKVHIRLEPVKAGDKANVFADVSIVKPADAGARETADQLNIYIADLARSVIGADEVAQVSVNILNIDTEGAAPPTTLEALAKVSATAPAAQAIVKPEPAFVEDEPEFAVSESVPEELVTYEESVEAAEEEEKSLTGQAEEDSEPELAVAWDAAEALPEAPPAEDQPEPDDVSLDDTSFDSLAIEESTAEDDEERPTSGG
jgi:hypothetical protein